MRDLSAQTGIGTDVNFLNGNLVDNQTLIGEGINQDIVQFFQKIAAEASIAPNGNPDNEANGYQLLTALIFQIATTQATLRKLITIGDWNMATTAGIAVAYPSGITYDKVKYVSAMIRNDDDTDRRPLTMVNEAGELGGGLNTNAGGINLFRADVVANGYFPNNGAEYDAIGYNRGWLLIDYEL